MTAVLEIRGLSVAYGSKSVLRGIDLEIEPGEILALVGESGSGKSTLLKALLGLLPLASGSLRIAQRSFDGGSRRALGDLADLVQMVFQDPQASLDPRWSARRCVAEALPPSTDRASGRRRVNELLGEVGLGAELADRLPHELSGGQRQRVAIARALAADPVLLLLDEATSALDVSVQAQILELIESLVASRGLAALFVAHDLAVVRRIADRCALLHAGAIVECRPTEELLREPRAAATRALLAAARGKVSP